MVTSLTWHDMLADGKQQPYFFDTLKTVAEKRQSRVTIHPPQKNVFNAFCLTELNDVKVVTPGQDPYYGPSQAHSLAFSARPDVTIPPSLLNMYKELEATIPGFTRSTHGYLEGWAHQGILLFNTVLTVRAGQVHSHASFSQKTFTDKIIALVNEHCEGVVFLLWDSHTQKKNTIINRQRHCVLKVPYPSPLSAHRSFFSSNHFAQTNQWLAGRSEAPINWMPVLPTESE